MTSSINMKELARALGISKQSLELRMRLSIQRMGGMNTPNGTGGIGQLDLAEAKLLGLFDLSAEEMCALMRELNMIKG